MRRRGRVLASADRALAAAGQASQRGQRRWRHSLRLRLVTLFVVLALLAAEPGRVFSRDDILNRLRGHEADLYTRAVDIVVSRLRRKLEPLDCIKTLRNAGYTLAVARSEPA